MSALNQVDVQRGSKQSKRDISSFIYETEKKEEKTARHVKIPIINSVLKTTHDAAICF